MNILACGGDMTAPSGSFSSPNYPGNYAHRRSCVWNIHVQTGRRVTLTFSDIDIEEGRNCIYDDVSVSNLFFHFISVAF